jgi:phospholipid-binding lipoprotein MlaA
MSLLKNKWVIRFFISISILSIFNLVEAKKEDELVNDNDFDIEDDYYERYYAFKVQDPYEKFNRKMYKFNKVVDKYIIKPPAATYGAVLPNPAKRGVNSFINNLKEPLNLFYGIIEFESDKAFNSFFRFFINTTFGILGIFDVAEQAGLKKDNSSFGGVLKHYGVKRGPYIILPILGPSNIRDGFGTIVDIGVNPLNFLKFKNDKKFLKVYYGTSLIVEREKFIGLDKTLSEVSIDEYAALRSFYYQKNK